MRIATAVIAQRAVKKMQRISSIGRICLLLLATGGTLSNALCTHPLADTAGTCWMNGNDSVTVPCGHLEPNQNTSLTYYVHDTGHILASSVNNTLTLNISLSDVNKHICCVVDTEPEPQEHCYQIMESYAPLRTELSGFREPVFGQVFQLECPLVGSPPTLYYWKKYETIDMSTETSFSADVHFSDSGRFWYVDVITAEHSGMYVCGAQNGIGEAVYVDTTNFFLSVSGCPYHAPDVSVIITPSNKNSYREGESVQLVCTAVAVEEHEQPFWWREHYNGSMTLCSRPQYMLNNSFERSACRWTTILTIPDFSLENTGNYHCGFGYNFANTTLHLGGGSQEGYQPYYMNLLLAVVVIGLGAVLKQFLAGRIELQYTEEPPRDEFTYDAFISAHDEAKEFVLENILDPLESGLNGPSPYRLCWHSRDFIPGIPIMEQIARCIAESRKIIFVFSEHFSQSEFCRVELELAMKRYLSSRTRCIVPVALADKAVPTHVKQRITYLPILSAEEGDVAGKIAQIVGQPIQVAVDMEERLKDSLIEE